MPNVALRMGALLLLLVLLFGLGFGVGRLSGLSPRGVEVHTESPADHGQMP